MSKLFSFILAIFCCLLSFSVYAEDEKPKFTLNTTAFLDQGALPVMYTCDGKNVSPEIDWSTLPDKTVSLAFIVTDPSAPSGTYYHWILYNIPKSTTTITEGVAKLPAGVLVGKNSFGKEQYNGPCPPKGTAHSYIFTLYALDSKIDLPKGAEGKAVVDAVKKHTVGKVELTAVYSRWIK